ncbi:sialidase family protein [Marinilabilia salmonicolor]|uniref:sialidase family protein n=1 Tax=Marinilabilia salmonicolor TaxID=989 RepID=UPI00068595E0|nr:sialidase family protein [Marinilabilia salmonicolor]
MIKKIIAAGLLIPLLSGCHSEDNYDVIPPGISNIGTNTRTIPLVKEKNTEGFVSILIVPGEEGNKEITEVEFTFDKELSDVFQEASLSTKSPASNTTQKISTETKFSTDAVRFSLTDLAVNDTTALFLNLTASKAMSISSSVKLEEMKLTFDDKDIFKTRIEQTFRPAIEVRAAGQDNCDTYRIPGMVTTNEGTLIAVYDNRYTRSKDLQEHIDVGMSRSTDGGETWEPMQVIMDMGEWGGKPEHLNGVGDPAVLYDKNSGTIWVAALWMHGFDRDQMTWWASQPGIKPHETGQFLLVKSTDDGKTWSDPINITRQIKHPDWQLLLQGPGKGICMSDGTLVFPAQFKEDIGKKAIDGHQFTPHSTIIYSKDAGETWNIGTGAKTNTTEAQVVELNDGSLMLNMRDDRNRKVKDETNGRAVAVTKDMGQTWEEHPTSNSALIEPNCMASLIAGNVTVEENNKMVLFFSNPASKHQRWI